MKTQKWYEQCVRLCDTTKYYPKHLIDDGLERDVTDPKNNSSSENNVWPDDELTLQDLDWRPSSGYKI